MALRNSSRVLMEEPSIMADAVTEILAATQTSSARPATSSFTDILRAIPPSNHPGFTQAWTLALNFAGGSASGRLEFTALKNQAARDMVDSLQLFLDEATLRPELRRMGIYLLVTLAKNSECLPKTLMLHGVELPLNGARADAFGGYGDVYRGSRRCNDKRETLALKVLRSRSKGRQPGLLIEELLIWRQLSHPHLLRLLGFFQEAENAQNNSSLYMVSLWCTRGTLSEFLLSPEYLENQEPLRLLRDISQGLAYMHRLGFTHADIKPDNILVDHDKTVMIADFGLVVVGNKTEGRLKTQSGAVGTYRWAAPERLLYDEGECQRPQPPVDVWAFSCLIYTVYSGEKPFSYIKDDVRVISALHKRKLPARSTPPGMPPVIWSTAMQGWSYAPEDRDTMQVLAERMALAEQGKLEEISSNFPTRNKDGKSIYVTLFAQICSIHRERRIQTASDYYDKAMELLLNLNGKMTMIQTVDMTNLLEKATSARDSIDCVPEDVQNGYWSVIYTHISNPLQYAVESAKFYHASERTSRLVEQAEENARKAEASKNAPLPTQQAPTLTSPQRELTLSLPQHADEIAIKTALLRQLGLLPNAPGAPITHAAQRLIAVRRPFSQADPPASEQTHGSAPAGYLIVVEGEAPDGRAPSAETFSPQVSPDDVD